MNTLVELLRAYVYDKDWVLLVEILERVMERDLEEIEWDYLESNWDAFTEENRFSDFLLRGALAEKPNCPVSLMKKLVEDEVSWAREGLAMNPNLPVEIMEILAEDEGDSVRTYLAMNPNCPESLMEKFAGDTDRSI